VKVSDGKAVGASEIVRPDVGDIEPLGFSNDGTYFYKQSLRQSDAYQVEIDPNVWKAIGAPTAIASRFVHSTMDPVWSPDASALAYVAQAGRSSTSATVVVRDERSGSEQHFDMSMERGGQLRWFPDNKALLYADNAPRGRRFRRLDLTTKEVQTLLETSYSPVLATVIAPDGRSFMFTSSDPDNSERKLVMRFDIATREQAKVYEAVLAGSGGPPAFHGFSVSPDGRQMAFFRSSTDETGFFNWELMVAMLDNEHPRRVWRSPTFRTLPGKATWDTQGRGVFAVVSLGDPFRDRHEIWRVPLDGSEPYSIGIPMNGGLGGAPAIHPRGNRLAFTVESNTANVWTLKNLPFGAKAVR
jgi:hypothetical protein